MKRNPNRKSTFRPSFEALEERTVLNATAVFNAGTITITGDNNPNSIVIQGGGGIGIVPPQVTVIVNGVQVLQAPGSQVNAIQFQMGKKADSVQYTLTGALVAISPGSSRTISGDLGKGNDQFTANVQGSLVSAQLAFNVLGGYGKDALTLNQQADLFGNPAKVDCTLDGGKGKDTLAVNASNAPNTASPGVDIGGGQMTINLLGGDGKDFISAAYSGDLDGLLNLDARGGKGKDRIDIAATLLADSGYFPGPFNTRLPVNPTPRFSAQAYGEKDKDNVNMTVVKQGNANVITSALIDGGPQRDTGSTAGSNVPVTVVSVP